MLHLVTEVKEIDFDDIAETKLKMRTTYSCLEDQEYTAPDDTRHSNLIQKRNE